MAEISSSGVTSSLMDILMADEIQPGSAPSYQLCKTIYLYHPLGGKMVDSPISMAQSKPRKISVPNSPEELVVEAFRNEWKKIGADTIIASALSLSRIYGVSALYMGAKGVDHAAEISPWDLPSLQLFFNAYDPLNTAGSLVLNQDPLAEDFQRPYQLTAGGVPVALSRACVVMNERPIYIAFTSSAFGFVGRSVFQRALYPLKSFIQTMITDDMVSLKAGTLIGKMKPTGSIVDKMMMAASAIKRNLVKEAKTGNVISIMPDESIETIDLTNVNDAMETSRSNILQNVATAGDMPAAILRNETLTQGFGEGSEDAKMISAYVDKIRLDAQPLYEFMDRVVQHRAWSPEFYASIQERYPEDYKDVDYKTAFMSWRNNFAAEWPPYLEEPESEAVKVEEVKFRAIVSVVEVMLPQCDPENRARLFEWAADNLNENKMIFGNPLILDTQALADYTPEMPAPIEPAPTAEHLGR